MLTKLLKKLLVTFIAAHAVLTDLAYCPDDRNCPGVNEEYQTCGTDCPLTCGNLADPPQMCNMKCVEGCFCQFGYVRDEATKSCVSPAECSG